MVSYILTLLYAVGEKDTRMKYVCLGIIPCSNLAGKPSKSQKVN